MVLGCFPRSSEPVFLSLFHPCIARQQTRGFQGFPKFTIKFGQSPGNTQLDRFGLALDSSAADPDKEVKLAFRISKKKGFADQMPQ